MEIINDEIDVVFFSLKNRRGIQLRRFAGNRKVSTTEHYYLALHLV